MKVPWSYSTRRSAGQADAAALAIGRAHIRRRIQPLAAAELVKRVAAVVVGGNALQNESTWADQSEEVWPISSVAKTGREAGRELQGRRRDQLPKQALRRPVNLAASRTALHSQSGNNPLRSPFLAH